MIESRQKPAQRRMQRWLDAAAAAQSSGPSGALAAQQGFVLTHEQARSTGLTDPDLRRLTRSGAWAVPRRGVLSVLPRDGLGSSLEIAATAAVLLRPDAAISHECAALAKGLDVYGNPTRATLTTAHRLHAAARGGAVVRAAELDQHEVETWFGAAITTVPRTVADLARTGMRPGIVVAESALFNGLATLDELRAAVERQSRWAGVVKARAVLEVACAKSESPLESLTRLFLHEQGLPLPEPQAWIRTHRGWARVDGLWEEKGLILEVDGLIKYRDDPDARAEEKLRHAALERLNYRFVRITWEDIHRYPRQTAAYVRRMLTCSPQLPRSG